MCTNGLGQWDAQSDHRRCPIFREILQKLEDQYRGGPDEEHVTYNVANYPVGSFASGSIERLFEELLAAETNLTVLRHRIPHEVFSVGRSVNSVQFASKDGTLHELVSAATWVERPMRGIS